MNTAMLAEVHDALVTIHATVETLKFSQCDRDDVDELIARVESELHNSRPNVQVMGTFLNSIARSLRTEPSARDACLRVSGAIDHLGVANTWEN